MKTSVEDVLTLLKHFQEENPPNIPEVDPAIDGLDESILAISLRMP